MTPEHLSSSLIIPTYKEQVDELKLVDAPNHFRFENEQRHRISI